MLFNRFIFGRFDRLRIHFTFESHWHSLRSRNGFVGKEQRHQWLLQEVKKQDIDFGTANQMEHSLCNMQSVLFSNWASPPPPLKKKGTPNSYQIEQLKPFQRARFLFRLLALFSHFLFHGILSNYTFNNP